jgi:flagellar hook assembly protein FlgD
MSNVGSVSLLAPSTSTSTTGNASSTLTQADFLKLMVAQFTQQDPLASSDGSGGGDSGTSDYVNQLMSMTNLTTLQSVSAQQGVQLAQTMPGSTVSVTDSTGNTYSGPVQQTIIDSNGVNVVINGVEYPSSDITAVSQSEAQAAAASAATAAAGTTGTTGTTSTN